MRWEYSTGWVYRREERDAPWLASGTGKGGKDCPLGEYLERIGHDRWELVSAVVSEAYTSAAGMWYHPTHWLYFKRPKS